MEKWTLKLIIKHFDDFFGSIDFAHMPERGSEEYRLLVLQQANDVMFSQGRYSQISEWTLEMFDLDEVNAEVNNLEAINRLTPNERVRLSFYKDLKEVCYPLFRGKRIDWSAWPWLLASGVSSLDNHELFELITRSGMPCLSAAILYDLKQLMTDDEEQLYSPVARQEAESAFFYTLDSEWNSLSPTDEGKRKKLQAAVCVCADQLWDIENHSRVGRLLGFDQLTQSVYDVMDTFIDSTYRHQQVLFAQELTAWIKAHWHMDDTAPTPEQYSLLHEQMQRLMKRHHVESPDIHLSWNLLVLDVLRGQLSAEQVDAEEDDNLWC